MAWGVGGKNLTARIVPDMLGRKMGTKRVPMGALSAPTVSYTHLRAHEPMWAHNGLNGSIWEFLVCPCSQTTPQAMKGEPLAAGDE